MKERKTFTFDGENSADYGLYISGDSVYNAPNREIDMISIPGRNGQLAIDMGRYENITVTYPAFVFADTQEEFREKIRRIRNWLCSKTSYQRLTDEYNPESFRLGLYKSGLEVEPIFYNRCGEFEMSFDCKPQRFLFTGEEVFTLGEWGETETYSGSIVSFEGTETTAIKSLTAQIVPKQSGSGDPSPSNVRPISGYDTVNVTRCGKNLCNPNLNSGLLALRIGGIETNVTTSNRYGYTERIDSSNALTVSATTSNANNFDWFKVMQYVDGVVVWVSSDKSFTDTPGTITIGVPARANSYIRIAVGSKAGYVVGSSINGNVQTEIGNTATAYEPYNGTSYPISLGQTVYGGTLEVMSGKLTLTHAIVDMGTLSWSYYTAGTNPIFSAILPDSAVGISGVVPSITSDRYTAVASNTRTALTSLLENGQMSMERNYPTLHLRNTAYTDATTFKTAMNGAQLVYELATPTEITLTPTQVKTLLGNNNIFADSGSVTVEIGENPYILVNPTKFEATPIFEVEGSGTLSVGDTTLTINNDGTTIIDTEMMEAYEDDNGAIISRNDDVEGGFPTLTSGINNVEADGLTSVKITPKFWEL